MNENDFGIYIHIPFCARKCIYCDFLSFRPETYGSDCITKYFDSLSLEIDEKSDLLQDRTVSSVFIGGGTPSFVNPYFISKVMDKLRNSFKFKNTEITIEVNPGTVNKESFKIYREAGINRISFGLQSMDNQILSFLNRIHTKEYFLTSLNYAREEGFYNINADLLMGVPTQSVDTFESTLKQVVSLDLPHLSCYSLILEQGTEIYRMIENGKIVEPDDETDRIMYHMCNSILKDAGYNHYELSNYAKNKYECAHNILYWHCDEYLGLGLGASSYLFNERFKNVNDLNRYLSNDFSKNEIEFLSEKDKMNEFMMLGFRLTKGPNADVFYNRFKINYIDVFKKEINALEKRGLITTNDDESYCLTTKGLDLANQVFMEFV